MNKAHIAFLALWAATGVTFAPSKVEMYGTLDAGIALDAKVLQPGIRHDF